MAGQVQPVVTFPSKLAQMEEPQWLSLLASLVVVEMVSYVMLSLILMSDVVCHPGYVDVSILFYKPLANFFFLHII